MPMKTSWPYVHPVIRGSHSVRTIGIEGKKRLEQNCRLNLWVDLLRAIEVFSKTGYIKQIHIPEDVILYLPVNRFFVENAIIYFPCISTPIVCFDENGVIYKKIGAFNEKYMPDLRILLKGEGVFFSVGTQAPEIEKYSFDGELLEKFDMMEIPIIKDKVNYINKLKKDKNSVYHLFKDAYYENQVLYLLVYDYVVSLHVKDKIHLNAIYKLDNLFYTTLSISESRIFLFNAMNADINVFHL